MHCYIAYHGVHSTVVFTMIRVIVRTIVRKYTIRVLRVLCTIGFATHKTYHSAHCSKQVVQAHYNHPNRIVSTLLWHHWDLACIVNLKFGQYTKFVEKRKKKMTQTSTNYIKVDQNDCKGLHFTRGPCNTCDCAVREHVVYVWWRSVHKLVNSPLLFLLVRLFYGTPTL